MDKQTSDKLAPGRSSGRRLHSSSTRFAPLPHPAKRKARLQLKWADGIHPDQWEIYQSAIGALRGAGIQFLLGGGFALAAYIGRWRNTKDIDFYVLKEDRQAAIDALKKAGFKDYFDQLPYDRKWIYRSTRSGVIVDIIWAMANQRAEADELWFQRSLPIHIRGESLHLVPIEEFMWCKLYILQRDHCDWTDVFNLLYAASDHIDWNHLLWRLEEDSPLLKGLLQAYGWLCPRSARKLPEFLRRRLELEPPEMPRHRTRDRIRLLDTRGWFAALLKPDQPLEV
jgi:hypothetical protein